MGKFRNLGRNTLLVFIGNIGAKLIGLLMLPFYTRWLSVEDYGTTDIISVYVTFLIGIVTGCISEAIFIFPKGQEQLVQKKYFSSGIAFLVISFSLTTLLFFLLDIIGVNYKITNSFFENIWLIYGMLISMVLQQFIQQFTRSIDKMLIYSVTGIILTIFTALLAFLLIPLLGVTGYVLSIIIANIIATLYSAFFSEGYKYFSIHAISISSCKEMLRYSIPLIPNGIMWWLVGAFNRPLMETYLGMHSIGIFAVANKFPSLLTMVFSIFGISWQTSVLEEFGKKDYESFYNFILRIIIICLFFLLIGISLCSKLLIDIFATDNFMDASKYIPLLTLGSMFSCIASITGSHFSATRDSKYYFYSSIWGAVTTVLINIIAIPTWGIWGVGISIVSSFMVMSISRICYSWKYVHINNLPQLISVIALSFLYIILINIISEYSLQIFITLFISIIVLIMNKDIFILIKQRKTSN